LELRTEDSSEDGLPINLAMARGSKLLECLRSDWPIGRVPCPAPAQAKREEKQPHVSMWLTSNQTAGLSYRRPPLVIELLSPLLCAALLCNTKLKREPHVHAVKRQTQTLCSSSRLRPVDMLPRRYLLSLRTSPVPLRAETATSCIPQVYSTLPPRPTKVAANSSLLASL
jgi:hypothetical protein